MIQTTSQSTISICSISNELMSDLKAATNVWLGRAVAWRNEDVASLPNIADQLKACIDIAFYLSQLKDFIHTRVRMVIFLIIAHHSLVCTTMQISAYLLILFVDEMYIQRKCINNLMM